MSLRINHNLAAMNANRNLKLTTSALNKSMQKLSSGFRINAAADDPAGLVISEQFRSQIAGLNRAIQNSEGSISMIQTAEGALTEINSLLISMRELAIHAANEGFNDVDQLAADQAEIENAIKTIDRIAANTQFGTKKILDGTKDNIATITSANSSDLSIRQSNLSSGVHSISATKTADASATLNTTSLGLSLANTDGDPYNLAEKIHTIDVVQSSDVAKKTSGNVELTDAFGLGLTLAATATTAQITSTAVGAAATASNAGTYTFTVNYQENGESPTGNQTISLDIADGDTVADVAAALQAQVNLNAALSGKVTVEAVGNDITFRSSNAGAQYSIQTQASSSNAVTSFIDVATTQARGVSANVLNFTVDTVANADTTADVTVAAGTYTDYSTLMTAVNTGLNAAFGDVDGGAVGTNDIEASLVDSNKLQFATRDEGSDYSIKLNAGVAGTGNLIHAFNLTDDSLAVSGTDALVSLDNYTNTITSVKYGTTGTTTLYSAAEDSVNRGSIDMIVANGQNGVNIGNLLLDAKAAKFDVRLDGGPATSISAGLDSVIYNADRTESLKVNYGLTSQGGTETINNTDQSLVFQIGANVGQTAAIAIRNMSSSSLGKSLAGNMFRSLSQIDVTTVQGAQDAQQIIDAAINEVSTTRGTLGSFQKNTLESNLRNLRIASQNLTASESQIRDTDMAEEMSEFTKNQILVQAGTSMLAQANQVPQVVLSLFR
ncbi:MAG: flagellin [Anaerolineales bacterium]|jgi:flagellin